MRTNGSAKERGVGWVPRECGAEAAESLAGGKECGARTALAHRMTSQRSRNQRSREANGRATLRTRLVFARAPSLFTNLRNTHARAHTHSHTFAYLCQCKLHGCILFQLRVSDLDETTGSRDVHHSAQLRDGFASVPRQSSSSGAQHNAPQMQDDKSSPAH
jgi:hypothetical protein